MPEVVQGSRSILLIDEDPRVGRLVRLSLHGPDCQVVICSNHVEGLRQAARQKPDLILMETLFKGADGLHLGGKLLQAPETQRSALAFLSSEESIGRRFRAIQMGACDYLGKPVEGRALTTRVAGIFSRLQQRPPRRVSGPGAERLVAELERLERDRASGTLHLQRGSLAARIVVVDGELRAAECGPQRGEEALNEIAAHGDWTLSVAEDTERSSIPERSRRITDETRPAAPKPMLQQGLLATSTVPDVLVAAPRPRPVETLEPESIFTEDERTIVDPKQLQVDGVAGEELDGDPPQRFGVTVPEPLRAALDAQPTGEAFHVPAPIHDETLGEAAQEGLTEGRVAKPPREEPTLGDTPRAQHAAAPLPAVELFAGVPPQEERTVGRLTDPRNEQRTVGRPTGPLQPGLSAPGEGFDEDMPTAMSFKIDDLGGDPSFTNLPPAEVTLQLPGAEARPGVPQGSTAEGESLRGFLEREGASLLLAAPATELRARLVSAVEQLGFKVLVVETGLDAYTTALQRHPLAIISDQRGPDLDGRELLAAIRSDFQVRETPFLMVSSEFLGKQLHSIGAGALAPVLQGLQAALAPRAALAARLQGGDQELGGWVEPIGAAHLVQAIGHAGLTVQLLLLHKEGREAKVVFRRGQICAASVQAGGATVGPLAMLNLLGYEWQEYKLLSAQPGDVQVPLGRLDQLVESAFQQNNLLLARVYQQGFELDDLAVDWAALERTSQKLPASSRELLTRLAAGEHAVTLVESGVGSPGLLKSLLHELRRKAVLQVLSMRPVRVEPERMEVPPLSRQPRRSRRWLVITIAGLITVLCAVGGYLLYLRYGAG